jgi:hypothetical protein
MFEATEENHDQPVSGQRVSRVGFEPNFYRINAQSFTNLLGGIYLNFLKSSLNKQKMRVTVFGVFNSALHVRDEVVTA